MDKVLINALNSILTSYEHIYADARESNTKEEITVDLFYTNFKLYDLICELKCKER